MRHWKLLIIVLLCVFEVWFSPTATAANPDEAPSLAVLERTTEPLLKSDHPWEDFSIGYCQVMKIGDQWHMWYSSNDRNYHDDDDTYLCYARSEDGVHWEKPSLGIYSYQGSTDNNILCFATHGVTVFHDEKALPLRRFKAVGVREHQGDGWWIYGATSPDGLHWSWREEPLLKQNSDTANVCIRDDGVYRLYVRMWTEGLYAGKRIIGYCESATFGDFGDPVAILSPDDRDPADFHFYNAATTKLADDLYLMFPSGFFTDSGNVVPYAAFSRDGKSFQRLGRTPLLELGEGFDKTGIYIGPGAIPAEKPNTYWIYYTGVTAPHDGNDPSKISHDGAIGRFLLEVGETEP